MDYTTQNLGFKIRKAVRYVRLYGIGRTLMKIKGQYHMKKRYVTLPARRSGDSSASGVGIIGCGNYAFSNIAFYLRKKGRSVRIIGAMDIDINKAASLFEHYGLNYYTSDEEEIIKDPQVSLVYIASNHASHAEYAIRCINSGKSVHIEKPHVVSEDQLSRLLASMRMHTEAKVFLGFNRPRTKLFKELQSTLEKESGPLMINWFVAGHEIPEDHWYFDEKEGGRVLGNLCHWTDLTLQLVTLKKAFPCTIIPATPPDSKSDYVVSIQFSDRSCASITFSAKGHTFEGVREVLNVHKGNVLANLTDFQALTMEVIDKKVERRLFHRDHGHGANIYNSLYSKTGESIEYICATAKFFLAIRQAIDSAQTVKLSLEEALGGKL